MPRKSKLWERLEREPGDGASLFVSPLGQIDLAGFRVLHHGLDTVRQLFDCQLKPEMLIEIHRIYDERMGEIFELGGILWLVGSGGKSGYKYRLQNSDTGLIIFVKSNYVPQDKKGGHIKIECSPHWIDPRDAETMERKLTALASLIADGAEPSGCAVHLCCDIQGWQPGDDFLERIVTRARRIVHHHSSEARYLDIGEIATVFGKAESYLMGTPSSVQCSLYRKDLQAEKTDKLHYWREVWSRERDDDMEPLYDKEQPVWRLEYRFHQNVISQFAEGHAAQQEYGASIERMNWKSIAGISKHLRGLWRYGLDVFRLEVSAHGHGSYVDPAWQLLHDDVKFTEPEGNFLYRRIYKTPGEGNERNLMLAVGNLLSCYARHRYTPKFAFQCLKQSGIYDDLHNYMSSRAHYKQKFFTEADIYRYVQQALQIRELRGVAA